MGSVAYTTINQNKIAYRSLNQESDGFGVLWCSGFKSDMLGQKAETIAEFCKNQNFPYMRFDYSGHGESSGDFAKLTLSHWINEAKEIYALTNRQNILIGSSMGGWVALKLAEDLARQGKPLKALILIAPAPDFTQKLMWEGFSEEVKNEILTKGFWQSPSPYDAEGYPITKALIDDGNKNSMLDSLIKTDCPIHILAGEKDEAVPLSHIEKVMNALQMEEITLTIVKDGDHRLSREEDLALLLQTLHNFTLKT